VGALNVGRIRIVGIEPDAPAPTDPPRELERAEELARFEMGSTIVLLLPPGVVEPVAGLEPGRPVRLGEAIGRFTSPTDENSR